MAQPELTPAARSSPPAAARSRRPLASHQGAAARRRPGWTQAGGGVGRDWGPAGGAAMLRRRVFLPPGDNQALRRLDFSRLPTLAMPVHPHGCHPLEARTAGRRPVWPSQFCVGRQPVQDGSGIGNSTPLDTDRTLVVNVKSLIVLITRHFRHLKATVRRDLRFPPPPPFPASCTASNTHSSVPGVQTVESVKIRFVAKT
jgi:hypothetical protein